MAINQHSVPQLSEAVRLDRYVAHELGWFPSRAAARKAIKREEVLLNGSPVEGSRFLQEGMLLELLAPTRRAPKVYERAISIVYEDTQMAVVEKPPGLPTSGNKHRTLEHALPRNLQRPSEPDTLPWPRPVHRLDVRTGGLVICAKTASAHVALGRIFEHREIQKNYLALLVGRLEGQGEVRDPIEGRDACSRYRVLSHTPTLRTRWVSLVDLSPHTGRTHQLRIHMAGLGHPVLGDDLYGQAHPVLRGKGLYLWATEVRFTHPFSNEPMHLKSKPPTRFQSFQERETRRWEKHHG
ncbi:MAG: RluA family pseudouridine synthase [Myxococcota bacterium]|nr:RluA family pseudouridine synthase [Myxococcota bacterium]